MTTHEPTTIIDLLRHGEPVGGAKYRGSTDDPLSETGWQEMRAAAGDLCHWDRIVTSPLSRCAAFAEWAAERWRLPLEREPRLAEMRFGEWEGHSAREIYETHWAELTRFWTDPTSYTPPGAEPAADFLARVAEGFEAVLERYPGQRVLIVGHAGTIRGVLLHVLGMPVTRLFRLHVPYACLTRVRVDAARAALQPRLVFHNGTL